MAVRAETDITLTRVDDGAAGANGATFTPSVDVAGDISWTNDGGLPNPPTQNIMGPAGSSGVSVTSVKTQYYLSTSDSSPTGGSWSDTPQTFVSGNYYWTRDYIDYSDGTHDTSTPVYNQGLTLANEYAMSASDAADNASEYAARALGNLSTVQSVAETLSWIAQHGTMALTTDVALDPTHVYFVVDAGGDYVVGGVTYAVVTEPDVADIGTYYELTIDESLNNYVGTHLALTSEGLWLLPAASGTNKVLIATGAGSTYTTAGTYIIDSVGDTVASFRADGATIGINDGTESYLDLDYHSLQLIDKNGNTYFYVSDLRDGDGYAELTETKEGDGSASFSMSCIINSPAGYSPTATVNGSAVTVSNYYSNVITLASAPAVGSTVVITYKTQSTFAKAYTVGIRNNAADVGALSYAEGYDTAATDYCSHAEGSGTSAGLYSHAEGVGCVATNTSHAEGFGCEATKNHSHAQNDHTLASSANQTALGKYNKEDNAGTYAVIIGNGTSNNARSDALEVDWGGNVLMALDTTAASGTDHDLYAAITALGWESDVIV